MRVVLENGEREFLLEGPPLARGGEATVYPLPGEPELAAKVYHSPTPEHADKLAALIAARPAEVNGSRLSVAWPTARLLAVEGGGVVGCLMPRVSNARRVCELFNPRARRRVCPLFHYGYLLRTARNLAAAVNELHERGHVVGDLNESNVLVSPRAFVTLVDADSFQIASAGHVYRCRVGSAEYTPPELQGTTFADFDRRPEHDTFALAVLIFQLLMQGVHPFAGRFSGTGEPPPLPERIRAAYWPYALLRDGPFQPVPHAPPWEVLPPSVGELFFRCFEEGHDAPERRPSACDWRQALDAAALTACSASPQHHYPRGLDQCPWCALAREQDCDPFPTLEQIQAARRLSQSVADTSASAWGAPVAGCALGLDATDPLPPGVNGSASVVPVAPGRAPEKQIMPVAPARSQSWSTWFAVAAASALIGVLLVLCGPRPASPVQAVQSAARPVEKRETLRPQTPRPKTPARPAQPAPVRSAQPTPRKEPPPPVRPVARPAPPARPPQPLPVAVPRPLFPSPAPLAAVQKAERAWREAVQDLQREQMEYKRLVRDLWEKRRAVRPGTIDGGIQFAQARLQVQGRIVEEKTRVVQEKAQQLEHARMLLRARP